MYLTTFSWIDEERIAEPIVQVIAEPGEPDYGWQSYVVMPRSLWVSLYQRQLEAVRDDLETYYHLAGISDEAASA